ncbi:MAG TPA: phosphotransferase, partial [Polyangiales bacterium]|nr:phosphotransferase [Polyangiales bacterium]
MTDALALAFASIVRRIVPDATLVSHRPLKGGVSAAVYALEATSADGPVNVVLRRHGAATWKQLPEAVTRTEFQLLGVLRNAGLRVPRPLLFDDSAKLLPSPFFVMEWVQGTTDVTLSARDAALQQMAEFLARLHALEPESLSLPALPAREDPVSGTLQYLPPDPHFHGVREFVASYVVQPTRPALLHGDFWPGNLLWHNDQLAAVLDWEDA